MFGNDREQIRRMFVTTWQRARAGEDLEPLEERIAGVIRDHPEYHALLEAPGATEREWTPEAGQENPFLHMGMHITIREQVAIDRPSGIREAHTRLAQQMDSALKAEHAMMESLGEILWEAQRNGQPPDEQRYLADIRRRAGLATPTGKTPTGK